MISYSQSHVFQPWEIAMLHRAERWVEEISDAALRLRGFAPGVIRCHELARTVAIALNERPIGEPLNADDAVLVVDGKFSQVDHSWLELSSRNILDVYAVGSLPQVQLVAAKSAGLLVARNRCYEPGAARQDIDGTLVGMLAALFAATATARP